MTEKRFRLTTTEFDNTLRFYDAECDCETRMSIEYVLNKVENTLNALHEENQSLKKRLQDKDELLQKQLSVNNNLTRTIKHYETSLNNAIDHERTSLGRSVLKQYKNNLME